MWGSVLGCGKVCKEVWKNWREPKHFFTLFPRLTRHSPNTSPSPPQTHLTPLSRLSRAYLTPPHTLSHFPTPSLTSPHTPPPHSPDTSFHTFPNTSPHSLPPLLHNPYTSFNTSPYSPILTLSFTPHQNFSLFLFIAKLVSQSRGLESSCNHKKI